MGASQRLGALPGHTIRDGDGVRVLDWKDGRAWDDFVGRARDGTVTHAWAWQEAVRRTYGHRSRYLAATEGDRIVGVLPLTLVNSRLFGRRLVSLPFLDHAGLCTDRDPRPELPLVQAALDLASDAGAVLELRHLGDRAIGLACSLDKVTLVMELEATEEAQWRRLTSKRRNQIRKGRRANLVATIHGTDGLDDFYRVFARNMRDLGSPVHRRAFFAAILESLSDRTRIIVVRSGGRPVGAGVILMHGGVLTVPWSSSLREFFAQAPNQVLYWEAMRFGIDHGLRLFDFGRSSPGSGTYVAKRDWGAEPLQLNWHYAPETAEPSSERVQRMAAAARLWRRLPVGLANLIGPRIRGGITN